MRNLILSSIVVITMLITLDIFLIVSDGQCRRIDPPPGCVPSLHSTCDLSPACAQALRNDVRDLYMDHWSR